MPLVPRSCLPRRAWASAALILVGCTGAIAEPGDDDDGGGERPEVPDDCVAGPEASDDGVDNDCDGLVDERRVCGAGEADFRTLGAGVAATASGGALEICAGTYREVVSIAGKAIELRGEDVETTILDAGAAGTALTITGGREVTIDNLTIRGGRTAGPGGGIRCVASGLRLRDSAVLDNRAGTGGGGVHADGCEVGILRSRIADNEGTTAGGGALLIGSTGAVVDSVFTGNAADDGGGITLLEGDVAIRTSALGGNLGRVHGGGLYQGSDAAVEGCELAGNQTRWTGGGVYVDRHAPRFSGNTIRDNTAVHEGGGLYLHESRAVLADNRITGNTADDDGGGVRLFSCDATLERNHIAGNHAEGDGGGVKSSHVASLFIDNQVIDNTADAAGGGLELDNDSSVVLGGVVSGNRASMGGGIHAMLWPWSGGLLEGVQVVDNHAWHGGGLYLEDNFQPIAIRALTVTGNTAERGAGVYASGGHLVLGNSLLAGNVADGAGGALYVTRSEPWTEPCPCPPADPRSDLDFVVIHDNAASAGSALWTDAPNLSIENSIVSANAGTAVTVAVAAPAPGWRYNDTYPVSFAGMPDPTGSHGNQTMAPQFADPAAGDFRLQATSLCVDAGDPMLHDPDGSRADMGQFAGPGAP